MARDGRLQAVGIDRRCVRGALPPTQSKLAKELGSRGVNKGTVARIAAATAASTVQVGVRAVVSVGIAAAYALASVVSLVVWVSRTVPCLRLRVGVRV